MLANIIISGDRHAHTSKQLTAILAGLDPAKHRIVHGGCTGIDALAGKLATAAGFEVVEVPADWGKQGKSAGPRRNARMLKLYPPMCVFLFHDNIGKSKGTKNMKLLCKKTGAPCTLLPVN